MSSIAIKREPQAPQFITTFLGKFFTSTASGSTVWIGNVPEATRQNYQEKTISVQSPADNIAEIRRISGLTWEQLAEMFGVSRRTIHFWASGEPPKEDNDKRIGKVLEMLRSTDKGDPLTNKNALLRDDSNGVSPFSLIIEGKVDEARLLLGTGSVAYPRPNKELSLDAQQMRKPPPPAELVGAMQDYGNIIVKKPHKGRGVKTARKIRDDKGG